MPMKFNLYAVVAGMIVVLPAMAWGTVRPLSDADLYACHAMYSINTCQDNGICGRNHSITNGCVNGWFSCYPGNSQEYCQIKYTSANDNRDCVGLPFVECDTAINPVPCQNITYYGCSTCDSCSSGCECSDLGWRPVTGVAESCGNFIDIY